jgi:hypothetical protein
MRLSGLSPDRPIGRKVNGRVAYCVIFVAPTPQHTCVIFVAPFRSIPASFLSHLLY